MKHDSDLHRFSGALPHFRLDVELAAPGTLEKPLGATATVDHFDQELNGCSISFSSQWSRVCEV